MNSLARRKAHLMVNYHHSTRNRHVISPAVGFFQVKGIHYLILFAARDVVSILKGGLRFPYAVKDG